MIRRRSVHEKLSTQQALLGLLQTHYNSTVAELAGMSGYDFVIVDLEHGVFSDTECLETLRVLSSVDTLAVVRLRGHDLQAVGRFLDMGVDALLVPNVSTAEQATTLVHAMDYPPAGTRGFGAPLHRETRFGVDLPSHLKAPREGICLLVIVESALGVVNIDSILAVDGVDGVIIGPFDLTADMGCAGDFSQQKYKEAIARIEAAAKARGKLFGTVPHSGQPLDALLDRGHRILILGADTSLIREAMSTQVNTARSCRGMMRNP